MTADLPEDAEESEEPLVDPMMDEAKQILLDYIDMLNGAEVLTAGRQAPDAGTQ
jgi:hypothetical protein